MSILASLLQFPDGTFRESSVVVSSSSNETISSHGLVDLLFGFESSWLDGSDKSRHRSWLSLLSGRQARSAAKGLFGCAMVADKVACGR